MFVTLGTGDTINLDWNGRWWIGDCPKCGDLVIGYTAKSWHIRLMHHWESKNHE